MDCESVPHGYVVLLLSAMDLRWYSINSPAWDSARWNIMLSLRNCPENVVGTPYWLRQESNGQKYLIGMFEPSFRRFSQSITESLTFKATDADCS